MAYQRPLVLVYQEYAKLSVATQTTSLLPCIVGPCYHVIDIDLDRELAFLGDLTADGFPQSNLPSNVPGALVAEGSITLLLREAVAQVSDADVAVASFSLNELTFTELTFPEDIELGDIVTVTDTEANPLLGEDPLVLSNARVIEINAETYKLKLNRGINTDGTLLEVDIKREIAPFTLTTADSALTFDANKLTIGPVNAPAPNATLLLVRAKLFAGYTSLRQDLSNIGTLYNIDELTARLGKATPDNPLAYGAAMCLANTVTAVKFIGVDTDDVIGYAATLDRLETDEDVYAIVPLSQNPAITSMFKNHAEQMSTPEMGRRRVAIISSPLMITKTLATGTATVNNDSATKPTILIDSDASWMSDGVEAGHKVTLTTALGAKHTYTVDAVLADDMLKLTEELHQDLFLLTYTYSYTIYRELDKTAQAREIANVSSSYNNRRCVHVWPGTIVQEGVELPSYYLAATVAGMTAGLPSHQGFTRLAIAGIERLKYANEYFNQAQLDIIAGGGTFIFLQENPNAAPYVRHQLTTDMSTIEFQEFSFQKNFDYVSKLCQIVMDRFLGTYNICDETMPVLSTAIRATLESLRLSTLPKIGAPIRNFDIDSVEQLDDMRTRVEIYVSIDFPYPLNTIGLHLVSR